MTTNTIARASLAAGHGRRNGDKAGGLSDFYPSTNGHVTQDLRGANGRIVARIDGDCLKKQVDGSRHFLRKPAGIAFDRVVLESAEAAGAVRCEVRDRETGATYRAMLGDFWRFGVNLDRGFGAQTCLPFNFWCCERPGDPRQLAFGFGA